MPTTKHEFDHLKSGVNVRLWAFLYFLKLVGTVTFNQKFLNQINEYLSVGKFTNGFCSGC